MVGLSWVVIPDSKKVTSCSRDYAIVAGDRHGNTR